jgi:hypothetical protein
MYDIVIVHGPNDDEILPHCVEHIKKNVGKYRHIYIISFDASSDIFEEEILKDCRVYDESVFPFSKSDVNTINQTPNRDGWYLQQILKLYVSLTIEEMLDDYVIIDSDVLFLKPIEFKSGSRYLYNMAQEQHIPYFEHMKRLHPTFKRVYEQFGGVAHHMIFNRDIVKEMFKFVEDYHSSLNGEHKPFWKIFLEQVEVGQRWASGASEYEIYINYMLQYHKEKVIPRKLKFEDTGAPVWYVLQNFVNTDIAYAALHAWRANRQPRPKKIKDLNMISGEAFQMLCETTVITREIEGFHTSLPKTVNKVYLDGMNQSMIEKLNNSKSIFVYTHILDRFISELLPKMTNSFVLMTHNSDHSINESHLPLLNDNKLIHMFSQNTFIEHPKLTALPIGIANSMWHHGQRSSIEHVMRVAKSFTNRKGRIYVNVSEGTNYAHRSGVVKSLRNNDLSDMMPSNRPHPVYLEEMSGYKWVASPKGNGVDCHRLWEVMYAGSIAICDDSVNARAFKNMGLPIILIGDGGWDNITLEFLQEETKKLMSTFKGNRHSALDLNWWKTKINSYNVNEGAFVLVYLGVLRDYIYECVKQIRLWNPVNKVYLCINNDEQNKPFIDLIKEFNIDVVYVEDLQMTEDHTLFIQRYTNMSIGGLWRYSMERFFILEETMSKYNLKNIFHLEIDNLVYFKVDELLEKCKSINKVLITSDSERRYIAGTCFVNNPTTLSKLNKFFTERGINRDEMHTIMEFTKVTNEVDCWPVLPSGDNTRLIYEERRHLTNDIQRMSKHFDTFKSVGDAACIGQYFFGIDKFIHNPNNTDGFINKDTIFSVDRLWFKWEKVNGLQRLNMSVDKENWYPITNIHVHNKSLERGMSDIPEMTKHLPNII